MINKAMRIYVLVLVLAASLALIDVVPTHPVQRPVPLVALCVLSVVLSSMAIELPFSISLSLAFAPIFAGMLYAGPLGGALLGAVSAISLQEIRDRKPVVLMLGNAAQLAISGLAGGMILIALGSPPLETGLSSSPTLPSTLLPALAAMITFYAVNLLLVGIAVSLQTGMRAAETIRTLGPGSYWVSLVVLGLLGLVIAHLLAASSWAGLLLLVLPFTLARRTFRVYVELSEAYTSTVRSLATAIEAKDPYTRGHSERVAVYARRLSESLGMSRADADLVERAALLHDIGKIGIDVDTLTSHQELAPHEVNAIRRHPTLGSQLLGDVEFLSDIVPVVRHHHERMDGTGYPDGLSGDGIPPLARVLAIADSYDAMTSDRAYRPRMTKDQALGEIAKVAGTQLDRDFVSRFAAIISDIQVG